MDWTLTHAEWLRLCDCKKDMLACLREAYDLSNNMRDASMADIRSGIENLAMAIMGRVKQ